MGHWRRGRNWISCARAIRVCAAMVRAWAGSSHDRSRTRRAHRAGHRMRACMSGRTTVRNNSRRLSIRYSLALADDRETDVISSFVRTSLLLDCPLHRYRWRGLGDAHARAHGQHVAADARLHLEGSRGCRRYELGLIVAVARRNADNPHGYTTKPDRSRLALRPFGLRPTTTPLGSRWRKSCLSPSITVNPCHVAGRALRNTTATLWPWPSASMHSTSFVSARDKVR